MLGGNPHFQKTKVKCEVASRYQKQPRQSHQNAHLEEIQRIQEQTETIGENTAVDVSKRKINPLEHWRKNFCWPEEYLKLESNMNHLLLRKKSSSYLRDKQLEPVFTRISATPSDQIQREAKSNPYRHSSYQTVLAIKSSFMGWSDLSIIAASKKLCQTLLETEQSISPDSLFHDTLFNKICKQEMQL
ncbi:hypothetical protein ACJ73_09916 [Blastomyces percursus]|uniref:Uncharacterized protein n=1 Tax=Blastomyces percursus TaxID=1658174 RepID=A0A1J9P1U1_9EURO|nr:hypothetical protein ACJ73_09916 [Blastomyces percursus]